MAKTLRLGLLLVGPALNVMASGILSPTVAGTDPPLPPGMPQVSSMKAGAGCCSSINASWPHSHSLLLWGVMPMINGKQSLVILISWVLFLRELFTTATPTITGYLYMEVLVW